MGMHTGLHLKQVRARDGGLRHPDQSAFVLLLVLMLTAVLGGAVLATQLMVQQRLHAAAHRNQRYQRRVAADAAVRQVLAMNRIADGTTTQAVVMVPLPDPSRVTIDWEPAPASAATMPHTWRITAKINGGNDDDAMDYTVRRDGDRWRMERW